LYELFGLLGRTELQIIFTIRDLKEKKKKEKQRRQVLCYIFVRGKKEAGHAIHLVTALFSSLKMVRISRWVASMAPTFDSNESNRFSKPSNPTL
jgi:hypothetical protein